VVPENASLMEYAETDPVPDIATPGFWDMLQQAAAKAIDTGIDIWRNNNLPEQGTPYNWNPAPYETQFGPPSPGSGKFSIAGYSVGIPALLIGGAAVWYFFLRKGRA